MSSGITNNILSELWSLIIDMRKGMSRSELVEQFSLRTLENHITKLKKAGIHIKYLRKEQRYHIGWPQQPFSFTGTDEELFYFYYTVNATKIGGDVLNSKMNHALNRSSDFVYSISTTEISEQGSEDLKLKFDELCNAIRNKLSISFKYPKKNMPKPIVRDVQPYKIVHTPLSWYLLGMCEDSNEFRNFKLVRMLDLRTTKTKFEPEDLDVKDYYKDAWILQHSESLQTIEVWFTGPASKAIQEYKFHHSQEIVQNDKAGTLVRWKLRSLDEFSSWLLQWLPNVKINKPSKLREDILARVKDYWEKEQGFAQYISGNEEFEIGTNTQNNSHP